MSRIATSASRIPALLAVGLFVLTTAGCGDFTSVTDISNPGGPSLPPDVSAPYIALADAAIEEDVREGSTVEVDLYDTSGLDRAAAFLFDTETLEVLWASDTVRFDAPTETAATFTLDALDEQVPFGEEIGLTVWARDRAGNAGLAPGDTHHWVATDSGAVCRDVSDDSDAENEECQASAAPVTLEAAENQAVTVRRGQLYRFGDGAEIGQLAFNEDFRQVYLSMTSANEVRSFDLSSQQLTDLRIPVGSMPTLMHVDPDNFGPGHTLVVYNSGGTDVSLVDLSPAGGSERTRVVLPLIALDVEGGETDTELELRPDAHALTVQCPSRACVDPQLFLGSSALGSEGRGATRSLALTSPDALEDFDVITPEFRDVLPTDDAVTIDAFVTDRHTAEDSLLFSRTDRSACGTLAFGSTVVATADIRGAPIFIGEQGEAGGACGGSGEGRVFRVSHDGEDYFIEASSVVNFDRDDRLRGIEAIDVNADGTVVALRTADAVFVTNGGLRLLATLPVQGADAVALLEGMENGPGGISQGGLIAVAEGTTIRVFELEHFREVARYDVGTGVREDALLFVRRNDFAGLQILGVAEDGAGLLTVDTSIEELLERQP